MTHSPTDEGSRGTAGPFTVLLANLAIAALVRGLTDAPGGKAAQQTEQRPQRADETAEEPGQDQVQAHHGQEHRPQQPGRGVKTRLVAEPAQAVIGQGGQGQVDAAVHQGQRVDETGLHRAHEGQGQQEGQEVVFQGLQPAVAIGLHPAGRALPPARQPAGGLVDRAQGAGKTAEEPAHHQGQHNGHQGPGQGRKERAGGQDRGQGGQGVQVQEPVDGPAAQLPPGGSQGGRDAEPQEDDQEEDLADAADGDDAHEMWS